MDLVGALSEAQNDVLSDASEALRRAHLAHYEASGSETSHQRLADLFSLVVECLTQRTLAPMSRYAERVAQERFRARFDIGEVQTAFNVLEEAIWRVVIPRIPPGDLVEFAGLIGTVLGVGKDTLARVWVSIATSQRVPSLDLTALFEGAAS
ncbi:MAG TPA: hypothetical protein VK283_00340 [Acidimicrobiales bacterium]|nr:hypothetical protein [Acidimicrobiales bacterium]